MDDAGKRELQIALACALLGVASIGIQLALSHPATRMWLAGVVHRIRTYYRADPHEGIIRQFNREVSGWDHEQASQQDRKPAAGGPCGC